MHELTKSQFMDYLVCPAYCWLKVNQKAEFDKVSSNSKAGSGDFADQSRKFGQEIDKKAQLLFDQAVTIEAEDSGQAIQETQQAIESGALVLYQAGFGNSQFLIRADVVKRLSKDSNQWILYEVKSSTKQKKEHFIDLAFQKIVCQKVGYDIVDTRLILLNKEYRLSHSPVDDSLDTFFLKDKEDGQIGVSVNDQVAQLIDGTSKYLDESIEVVINQAKSTLNSSQRQTCRCRFKTKAQHCPTFAHFNPNQPPYSIYDLSRINQKKIIALLDADLVDIEHLQGIDLTDYKLSLNQTKQIELYPDLEDINQIAIADELNRLQLPLYFLDYETISLPVPVFKTVVLTGICLFCIQSMSTQKGDCQVIWTI